MAKETDALRHYLKDELDTGEIEKKLKDLQKASDKAVEVLKATLDNIDGAIAMLDDDRKSVDERNDNIERVLNAEIGKFIAARKAVNLADVIYAHIGSHLRAFERCEEDLKKIRIKKVEPPPRRKPDVAKAAKLLGIEDLTKLKKALEAANDGDDAEAAKLLQQILKEEAKKEKATDLLKELRKNRLIEA